MWEYNTRLQRDESYAGKMPFIVSNDIKSTKNINYKMLFGRTERASIEDMIELIRDYRKECLSSKLVFGFLIVLACII